MNTMTEYEEKLIWTVGSAFRMFKDSPERLNSYLNGCILSAIWLMAYDDPHREQMIEDLSYLLSMTYYIE